MVLGLSLVSFSSGFWLTWDTNCFYLSCHLATLSDLREHYGDGELMAFFPFGFVLRSFVWKFPVNPHLHVSCCYFLAFLNLVIILVISTCILLLFLCLVILFLRRNHSTLIGQRCDNILQWRMKLTFIDSERCDCAKCDMHTGPKSNFSCFLSNIHWNRNSFFSIHSLVQ